LNTKPLGTSAASVAASACLFWLMRARARPTSARKRSESPVAPPTAVATVMARVKRCSASPKICAGVCSGPRSMAAEQKPSPSRISE
jgi:hypothetical protein